VALSGHQCGADCKAYKDKDHPIPGRWQIGEWKFQRCPYQFIDKNVFWYIRAFNWMEKRFLPSGNGWLDLPNKLIEILDFISKTVKRDKDNG
jgi:hypothetical protein